MYGERVLESFRTSMQLRMELLPYLYTLCHESAQTGLPICRSNCIQEPAWEAGYHEWSSYFLGDRLYAAPVVTPGTTRSVSLPPGSWYNGLTGRRYESDGAAAITQVSPFDRPPLHYYRGGTAIVKQPYTHRASGVPESLILELFPLGRPCTDAFELYEDDGYSRRHENGEQALTSITMTEQSDAITVALEPVRGEYRGMPETRSYEIRVHALDDPTCTVDGSRARSASTASVQAFRTNALSVREPHTIVVRSRRTEHGGLRSEGEGAR
jgi:alpha-glucosidase